MPLRDDRPPNDRRTRDRALILPLVGLILFLPPVAGIFRLDATVLGVPITLGYVFVVWALLIAGAFALSRRLRAALDAPDGPSGSGDDP